MKPVTVETLSNGEYTFTAPVLYYESVDEADKAAGKQGACLAECNLNLDYRGARADVRATLVDIVQELTKVKPLEGDSGDKDEKGNPIMEVVEKDSKYVVRALQQTPSVTNEMVQKELTRRCSGYEVTNPDGTKTKVEPIAVDIKQRERKATLPPKLAKQFTTAAADVIAKKKVDALNARMKPLIGKEFKATGKPEDVEALGWLIKEYNEKFVASLAA